MSQIREISHTMCPKYRTFFATLLLRVVPNIMLDSQRNCSCEDASPDEQFLRSGKLGIFPLELEFKRLWHILGRDLPT